MNLTPNPAILDPATGPGTGRSRSDREAASFESQIDDRIAEAPNVTEETVSVKIRAPFRRAGTDDYVLIDAGQIERPPVAKNQRPSRILAPTTSRPSEQLADLFAGGANYRKLTDESAWKLVEAWLQHPETRPHSPRAAQRVCRSVARLLCVRAGIGDLGVRELPF